jgi:hypothetical protein
MNQLPQISKEDLNKVFVSPFIEALRKEIDKQKKLLAKTEQAYQSYYERIKRIDSKKEVSKIINETDWLKSALFDVLENEFPERREIQFSEEFSAFVKSSDAFINAQPENLILEQDSARFENQETDSLKIKILKPLKRIAYSTSILPTKFSNLFKKTKSATPYWTHNIPYRLICRYYFKKKFASLGLSFFEELQQLKCSALNLVTDIDIDINVEISSYLTSETRNKLELIHKIEAFSNRSKVSALYKVLDNRLKFWENECNFFLDDVFEEFTTCLTIVDTIELPNNKFSIGNLESEAKQLTSNYNRIFNGWKNTFFAKIDDFQVDIELYHLKYRSLQQLQLLQNSCNSRLKSTIEDNILQIDNEFSELEKRLQTIGSDAELNSFLQSEKLRINRKLEKDLIPKAIESIYNQNLPQLLDRLEEKLKAEVKRMKESRIIYSNSDFNSPIGANNLSHFNPRELVEIDILPRFAKVNNELKRQIILKIEDAQLNIRDLSGISDYNLDAAISSIEDKENKSNTKEITIEGINRVKSKAADIKKSLESIEDKINSTLEKAILEYNKQVISLTENENITQIRIKIAKAKALEKTEAYRKKIIQNIKGFLPIVLRFLKLKLNHSINYVEIGLKKIGLKEVDQKLTAELADYLAQTDKAIKKLPYVYKRLYQINPLEEDLFFVGRETELKELNLAYDSWKKGNYSATCMHGEKGSGASSLVNLFEKELQGVEQFRHKFKTGYYTDEGFLYFFREFLNNDNIKNFEELSDLLKNGKKKVIILEDVQHFYLKKIEGFNAIMQLFELISLTSENVFWLIEITSYTYKYLEKTIGIEQFFRYNIELNELNEEQIVRLIMKRHRVSGYNLQFESHDHSLLETRKFKAKSDIEKQDLLKESFFSNLNQFAQSNISLALLYWLRSTKSVEGNTIIMSRNKALDFTFLNNLDNDSIFTLHALILHDSLNVEEHSLVFHQSIKSSRRILMLLEDHGLLKSNENRYTVNRLLYRQVVNMLSNKNIIH